MTNYCEGDLIYSLKDHVHAQMKYDTLCPFSTLAQEIDSLRYSHGSINWEKIQVDNLKSPLSILNGHLIEAKYFFKAGQGSAETLETMFYYLILFKMSYLCDKKKKPTLTYQLYSQQ